MLVTIQMTTPLAAALVVALLATTGAIALSRETPTRVAISPFWPLGAWLVVGGALLSTSFMLSGAPMWMSVTIRVVAGIGTSVVLAIVYRVKRAERIVQRSEVDASPTLPAPYLVGRVGVLSLPQALATEVPLPYAA